MANSFVECSVCKHRFEDYKKAKSIPREPCPNCGSITRIINANMTQTITVSSDILEVNISHGDGNDFTINFPLQNKIAGKSILECSSIINEELIKYLSKHPEEMKTMEHRRFEELIAELFDGFGYEVELTKKTRDGGIDIIAIKRKEVNIKYLIECKRPKPGKKVGIQVVRQLHGVLIHEKATKGILATTTSYTRGAKEFSEEHEWQLELRDYYGIIEWIKLYLDGKKIIIP